MALYLSLSSMYCSLLHSLSLFATFLSLNSKCKNLLSLSGVLHSWKMKFWFCYYMVYECTNLWFCGMSKYGAFDLWFCKFVFGILIKPVQNRLNHVGPVFWQLNRRFSVLPAFFHFSDFEREPDRIKHRSPIEPTGPVRFLKPWWNYAFICSPELPNNFPSIWVCVLAWDVCLYWYLRPWWLSMIIGITWGSILNYRRHLSPN